MKQARVVSLHVYPVKGMRGISLQSARAEALGFAGDRSWMVVRDDGRCITQREVPALARVSARLDGNTLSLETAGMSELQIPADGCDTGSRTVRVWADECEVVSAGPDAERWLREALNTPWPCRMVRMLPGFRRRLARADRMGNAVSTLFADAAPYLVTNTGSLDAVNRALLERGERGIGMERFRSNVVLLGLEPFEEQDTARLLSDSGYFELCYPCERCIVTTTDQLSGLRDGGGSEPLTTLRQLNATPDSRRAPLFGMNAVWHGEARTIRIGDTFGSLPGARSSNEG